MREYTVSEKLLIKEVTEKSREAKEVTRGLSIGLLIKFIRKQLKMSQIALAKRAGMPQSTISRVEQGKADVNVSTLEKILQALSCELVLTPILVRSIDEIRKDQAKKVAEKQIRYVQGTMNLENQEPDSEYIQEVLEQETEKLLRGPSKRLWEEV
ncbi:MAG: hypothetical protein ChlgKO_05630 [Chlamydiales bacterium]